MVSRINEENDCWDVPGGTVDKNLPASTEDTGLVIREDPIGHRVIKPMSCSH